MCSNVRVAPSLFPSIDREATQNVFCQTPFERIVSHTNKQNEEQKTSAQSQSTKRTMR